MMAMARQRESCERRPHSANRRRKKSKTISLAAIFPWMRLLALQYSLCTTSIRRFLLGMLQSVASLPATAPHVTPVILFSRAFFLFLFSFWRRNAFPLDAMHGHPVSVRHSLSSTCILRLDSKCLNYGNAMFISMSAFLPLSLSLCIWMLRIYSESDVFGNFVRWHTQASSQWHIKPKHF